jgi:uncharacterized membrane protein
VDFPPFLPQAIGGSGLGMTLLVSMAIFIASSLMGSLYSYSNQFEDRGMSTLTLILGFFVTAIIGVVSFLYCYLLRCY